MAPLPGERFDFVAGSVWRTVSAGPLQGPPASLKAAGARGQSQDALRALWDGAWLRGAIPDYGIADQTKRGALRVVDLFCGCGAMSLGVRLAAEALGLDFVPLVAADTMLEALATYGRNLHPTLAFSHDLSKSVFYRLDQGLIRDVSIADRVFAKAVRGVDLLIGGPPCQGHSDLNNHSRRDDPKNGLYLIMPAMALALEPAVVIIENVPAVVHDRSAVVETTVRTLEAAGYHVTFGTIPMVKVGVAQRRKRHFLVATKWAKANIDATISALSTAVRPTSWAIDDLEDFGDCDEDAFNTPSRQSEKNTARIQWLFANNAYDLPNDKRPPCHRDKTHSYVSMYGRMRWDEPAQTVTSGFGSPGQGRYVHARRPRTLTPHEAARLQFFPDSFGFDNLPCRLHRSDLSVMIGNAVPPKASYILTLAALAAAGSLLK